MQADCFGLLQTAERGCIYQRDIINLVNHFDVCLNTKHFAWLAYQFWTYNHQIETSWPLLKLYYPRQKKIHVISNSCGRVDKKRENTPSFFSFKLYSPRIIKNTQKRLNSRNGNIAGHSWKLTKLFRVSRSKHDGPLVLEKLAKYIDMYL